MYKVVLKNPYTLTYTYREHRFEKGIEYPVPDDLAMILDDSFFQKIQVSEDPGSKIVWEAGVTEPKLEVEPSIQSKLNLCFRVPTLSVENGYGSFTCSLVKYVRPCVNSLGLRRNRLGGGVFYGELLSKQVDKVDTTIYCDLPLYYDLGVDGFKVAFTMIEATGIPSSWVDKINQMDLLLVPCRFSREVFRSKGVCIPIRVINFGARNAGRIIERPKRNTFTFLSWGVFSREDRKGVKTLTHAFVEEFNEPDVRLIIKGSQGCTFVSCVKDPRINYIGKQLTMSEMDRLMGDADCGVFATHGEGFGLCPVEAAASGLPVIITQFSAMWDWVKSEYFYPVTVNELEKAIYGGGLANNKSMGYWASINKTDLRKQMRYAYENQEEAKEKGKQAALYIRKYFNWKNSARKFVRVLGEELN